jgi:hypothetical protein
VSKGRLLILSASSVRVEQVVEVIVMIQFVVVVPPAPA